MFRILRIFISGICWCLFIPILLPRNYAQDICKIFTLTKINVFKNWYYYIVNYLKPFHSTKNLKRWAITCSRLGLLSDLIVATVKVVRSLVNFCIKTLDWFRSLLYLGSDKWQLLILSSMPPYWKLSLSILLLFLKRNITISFVFICRDMIKLCKPIYSFINLH